MAHKYPVSHGTRRVTVRRFALAFLIYETAMFSLGFGLDISVFQGICMISLIVVPIMIFPWFLRADTRETDRLFESPVVWTVLAYVCMVAFFALIGFGIFVLVTGEIYGLAFFIASFTVLLFALRMFKTLRTEGELWRAIRASRKLTCPSCGARVGETAGICDSCAAVVFWVPTWLAS